MSLVLWSGGCDSTLVLYQLAREEGTAQKPIRTLSIIHPQVEGRDGQAAARAKILRRFKQLGLHVESSVLTISQSKGLAVEPAGLPQPVMWLTSAVLYLSTVAEEKLYTGHIRGDDVWRCSGMLNQAFGLLCEVAGRKKAEWVTPLMDTSKWEVLRELKAAKLLDLCWWCEHPEKGKPCGSCYPCKNHAMAEWRMQREKPGGIEEGHRRLRR